MKYLLAVDGSAYSVTAFNHLVKIFKEADTVVIVYAIDHNIVDDINTTMALSGAKVTPATVSQGALEAEAVKAKYEDLCFKSQLKFSWFQQDGSPIEVIKHYIANNQVETLVLGTHGKGVLKRAVLGSVSNYFVNHAKIPTLVVPTKPE